MMHHAEITQEPLFYLFIAFTILLTLGYNWGKRRNKRIFVDAFEAIQAVLNPKDQQFTNIGGLTGYHANFVPKQNKFVRRVDLTITLLPRQSWLYYPFARLFGRTDRLYLVYHLSPKANGTIAEGHIIAQKYSRAVGATIENAEQLSKESLDWGGGEYFLYYADRTTRDALMACRNQIREPADVRHIALVPSEQRVFVLMRPRVGAVGRVVEPLTTWVNAHVEQRKAAMKQLQQESAPRAKA